MTIVSKLVGLGDHGRANMLRWAAATWETQGVPNDRVTEAEPVVKEFLDFAINEAVPGKLDLDGWAAQFYQAAEAGEIEKSRCPFLMVDYVAPSPDTTIYAVANAVRLFGEHPDQWELVRDDPALIPHAINETLRLESPVQHFTRVVTADHELAGVTLREGERVLLLYGSANRDERKYPNPDRFDVTRKPSDHLAFGRGEHACLGMQAGAHGDGSPAPVAGRPGDPVRDPRCGTRAEQRATRHEAAARARAVATSTRARLTGPRVRRWRQPV